MDQLSAQALVLSVYRQNLRVRQLVLKGVAELWPKRDDVGAMTAKVALLAVVHI